MLTLTRRGRTFLAKLEQEGLLVAPADRANETPAKPGGTQAGNRGTDGHGMAEDPTSDR